MSEPNLPTLRRDATVTRPPQAGRWESVNVRLRELADSFDLPDRTERRDMKAVPDVWAQVLGFQNALVQETHPQAAAAERQWRGLLSLFALAQVYARTYRLELQPVDTSPEAAAGPAGAVFRRVLASLTPRARMVDDDGDPAAADWTKPVLVYLRDVAGGELHLLGVLNPATLVAPGKASVNVRVPNVPWLADGLGDPTALTGAQALPSRDYAVLAAFLDRLEQQLAQASLRGRPSVVYGALLRRLRGFRQQARAQANGFDAARLGEPERTTASGASRLAPLYDALLHTTRPRDTLSPDQLSDCRVYLRPDCAVGETPLFNGLILLDAGLADSLGRRAQDISVWGHHSLKDVLEQRELREQVRRETAQAGWLLVTPDDFFTRELALLAHDGRVEGHGAYGAFADAVLPLSPLALMVHAPDQLLKEIDLDDLADGGRLVRLRVQVQGALSAHVLTRSYSPDGGAAGFNLSPRTSWLTGGIAAWPNFQHPAWRWNFLRLLSETRGAGLRPRFGVSAQLLAQQIAAEPTAEAKAAKAREWIDSETLAVETKDFGARVTPPMRPAPAFQRLRYVQDDEGWEELQVSSSAFEAVALARSRVPGEPPRPVGIVLLYNRTNAPMTGGRAVVAVDFGTTNTVVCVDGANQGLEFQDRVLVAIADPREKVSDRYYSKWTFVDFLPVFDHATPIPTVAKRREVTAGREPALAAVEKGEDERPLFSDLIYFQPPPDPSGSQTGADVKEFSRNKDRLSFNLKWGLSQATQETARRFIRQIMMMTSAELLAGGRDPRDAVWRFSYPEAMGSEDRRVLEDGVRRSWSDLFVQVQDGASVPAEHPIRPLTTEGAAAAKYFIDFNRRGLAASNLVVVMDVGGATTDIAVIRNRTPIWRGSFRLAGGDFVTHYIINNPRFFERIKLPDFAELRRGFSDNTSSLFPSSDIDNRLKAFGELLFSNRKFGQSMQDNYMESMVEPEGRGLKHAAWVYLGGMLFYMGLVARKLVEQGLVRPVELETVTFGLGGRGATYFKDFGGGDAPGSPLRQLLGCFRHGADMGEDQRYTPTVLMSDQAKLEVALGMVGDTERDREILAQLSAPPQSTVRPSGETLQVIDSEQSLARDAEVDATPGGREFEEPELDGLKAFLAALAKETRVRVDLKSEQGDGAERFIRTKTLSTLTDQLARRGQTLAADPDATVVVEPPFISALRALLDRLGRPVEERARYIQVREL